jgi:hypothetical protein
MDVVEILGGRGGHLGQHHILRQRQRLEGEMKRIERADKLVSLSFQIDRAAQEAQHVLHGKQVAHFLPCYGQNGVLPFAGVRGEIGRQFRGGAQRVRGVQVLDHQRVLYFCDCLQKEDRLGSGTERRLDQRIGRILQVSPYEPPFVMAQDM